ncbi:MAG: hypothetical protein WAW86_00935 [Gammaproteobacteria bacterium]
MLGALLAPDEKVNKVYSNSLPDELYQAFTENGLVKKQNIVLKGKGSHKDFSSINVRKKLMLISCDDLGTMAIADYFSVLVVITKEECFSNKNTHSMYSHPTKVIDKASVYFFTGKELIHRVDLKPEEGCFAKLQRGNKKEILHELTLEASAISSGKFETTTSAVVDHILVYDLGYKRVSDPSIKLQNAKN